MCGVVLEGQGPSGSITAVAAVRTPNVRRRSRGTEPLRFNNGRGGRKDAHRVASF